jgi:hypothetical protein
MLSYLEECSLERIALLRQLVPRKETYKIIQFQDMFENVLRVQKVNKENLLEVKKF